MRRHPTRAFWVESAVAAFTAFLLILTPVWHGWIEGTFGLDPDHHNWAFEWELAVCLLLTVRFRKLGAPLFDRRATGTRGRSRGSGRRMSPPFSLVAVQAQVIP
jgi:hypothetical protein